MWLIDTRTLSLKNFIGTPPPYAILSHTWLPDDSEVTFADFQNEDKTIRDKKSGFRKIQLTCDQAKGEGIDYAWVDTCCINKDSSTELSEAINSMFKWYGSAATCYAYLQDSLYEDFLHGNTTGLSTLKGCRWFSRGWTLQELVAPRDIVFFAPRAEGWVEIGRKRSLCESVEQITRIPREMLLQQKSLDDFSVAARMSWAAGRRTTREEDIAYCLLGLFDVNMPLLYGEGSKAFIRLQEEIVRGQQDDSLFAWCSTESSAMEFPYRGLFASSPEEFAGCCDIRKLHLTQADSDGITSMIGNGRVSLSCGVIDNDDEAVQVLTLNCYRGSPTNTQGIISTRIGFNTYLRSQPSMLVYSPPGPLHNITIEKHVLRSTETAAENLVSADDDIVLISGISRVFEIKNMCFGRDIERFTVMPRRFWIEHARFWRWIGHFTSDPTEHKWVDRVPVSKVVGGKVAFDIRFEEPSQWSAVQKTAANGRFLLILWIESIPGSRTWKFYLDAKHGSTGVHDTCFESSERPSRFKSRCELVFGDVIVCITSCRQMLGRYTEICPHLSISRRQFSRYELTALSQKRYLRQKKIILFKIFVWTAPYLFLEWYEFLVAPIEITWPDSIDSILRGGYLLLIPICLLIMLHGIILED